MPEMRLVYPTFDGRAKVEKTRSIATRLVEMPDGDHAYTSDSVWQDARRLQAPIMLIFQGRYAPYGATTANEDAEQVLFEIDCAEFAMKPPSVSKIWQRGIQRIFDWFADNIIYLFVIGLLAFGIVQVVTGGG